MLRLSELVTTIPVGKCVIRTAESVVFTCCPPAPELLLYLFLSRYYLSLYLRPQPRVELRRLPQKYVFFHHSQFLELLHSMNTAFIL